MPTRRTTLPGGSAVRWRHELATGNLELDLTAQRGDLSDGQASVVIGRDVLNRNRLAKAPGRKPVAISEGIPAEDQPLTTAIESDFHGTMTTFRSFSSGEKGAGDFLWKYMKFHVRGTSFAEGFPENYAIMELLGIGVDRWGAFTEDMVGEKALFLPASFARPKTIIDVLTTAQSEGGMAVVFDRFDWDNLITGTNRNEPEDWFHEGGGSEPIYQDGFTLRIPVQKFHDKRGIWVSNGQKFWLLQGGTYTLYIDIGDDSGTKGLVWRGTQISPWVFMFTNPKHPPRVISLEGPPNPGTTDAELSRTLSGLLPPDNGLFGSEKEPGGLAMRDFFDGFENPGSLDPITANKFFSSSMTGITIPTSAGPAEAPNSSTFRIVARVIDERTGAASAFVDVYTRFDSRVDSILDLFYRGDATQFQAFLAVDYVQRTNQVNSVPYLPLKSARATKIEFWRTRSDGVVYFHELDKQLIWPETGDLSLPFNTEDHDYSTKLSDMARAFEGDNAALGMSDSELLAQNQLFSAILKTGGLPPVCVEIASIDGATIAGGEGDRVTITIQKKTLQWPRVESGQIIRHSALDAFVPMPESFFSGDVRRLSRSTDTFQRFVVAGDVIVAVMRRGAHRIQRATVIVTGPDDNEFVVKGLSIRQLADSGVGTPWPDTVLSVGTRAAWVTPTGIRVYDPDADEGRGQLSLMKAQGMESWLTDALRFNMELDAGYDESRGTIHIRRHIILGPKQTSIPVNRSGTGGQDDVGVATPFSLATGKFLVDSAVVNLATGAWTLIEDDTGFRYVNATHVEAAPKVSPSLYSVDETGGVFQENYEGDTHPYDSLTVQADIDTRFTMPVPGRLHGPGGSFSSDMTGDVIRFYGEQFGRGGLARRITEASESVLTFDDLPLDTTAERFVIGASRMRIRWAPFQGTSVQTDKTLESLAIVALPGRRHSANAAWPDPPEKKLTVSVYRNLSDIPLDVDVTGVPIFGDGHVEFRTVDRHSVVESDGNQLEIEIEQLDARTDVVLSSIEARIREDGTENEDASTTA